MPAPDQAVFAVEPRFVGQHGWVEEADSQPIRSKTGIRENQILDNAVASCGKKPMGLFFVFSSLVSKQKNPRLESQSGSRGFEEANQEIEF